MSANTEVEGKVQSHSHTFKFTDNEIASEAPFNSKSVLCDEKAAQLDSVNVLRHPRGSAILMGI